MRRIFSAAIAAAMLVTPAAQAQEQVLKYRASITGLPLAKLKLFLDRSDDEYEVKARFKMVTLLRTIFNGDAEAKASGRLDTDDLIPRTFSFRIDGRKGVQNTALAFDEAGDPIEIRAEPALRKRSYSMTLNEAAGAVDPATAALLLISPRADACALSFDVFDGAKRHRISLTGHAEPAKTDNRALCTGRYERIAGFKAKYMTPERRTYPFSAKLRRDGDIWIPEKIWANTKFGPASATLD